MGCWTFFWRKDSMEAEEKVVIVPIDTAYMRQFPDPDDALRVRQKCRTVLLTRSMPHHRAHWIMHQILKYCRWPQPPRTARHNRYCFPTQAHINVMIASHRDFLAWAYQCDISEHEHSVCQRLPDSRKQPAAGTRNALTAKYA